MRSASEFKRSSKWGVTSVLWAQALDEVERLRALLKKACLCCECGLYMDSDAAKGDKDICTRCSMEE